MSEVVLGDEKDFLISKKILRNARDGDIGAIFGLGFPPFLGGPFRWADAVGIDVIVQKLSSYRDKFGLRFEPAPVLVEMAKSGATFHGKGAPKPGSTGKGKAKRSARVRA